MPRKSNPDSDILKGLHDIAVFIHVDKGVTAKLLQDGEIPGRFICNSWRVYKMDLIEWIRAGNKQISA
jgi:hypothetical protein